MFLKDLLNQYHNKKIKIFVDMDGVIADYNVGEACNYHKKRPLKTSIAKLEEISKLPNIELYILSVTRLSEGIEQKNQWLDKYAPFFIKENRNILSREANDFAPSKELKIEFLNSIPKSDNVIVVIDDDPDILRGIHEGFPEIVVLKDTVLVE